VVVTTLLPLKKVSVFIWAVSDWPTQLLPVGGVREAPLAESAAGKQLLDIVLTTQFVEQALTEYPTDAVAVCDVELHPVEYVTVKVTVPLPAAAGVNVTRLPLPLPLNGPVIT
jgi:hypothetical protein